MEESKTIPGPHFRPLGSLERAANGFMKSTLCPSLESKHIAATRGAWSFAERNRSATHSGGRSYSVCTHGLTPKRRFPEERGRVCLKYVCDWALKSTRRGLSSNVTELMAVN